MKKERLRQSNSGFSIITVLIAVSFAAILGLLVLYIALANYRMKASGLGAKDSFYTAEQAMEEIRTGLQQDVAEAASEAYQSVMENYSKTSDGLNISLDAQREAAYRSRYLRVLSERLLGAPGQYNLDRLKGYVDLTHDTELFDSEKEDLVITTSEGKLPEMRLEDAQGIVLKNLKVIYVDRNGLASIIETDLRLGIPGIQYPTPSTLPDLMNMIVVANRGIVVEGNQASKNVLQGSVYAGNLPQNMRSAGQTLNDDNTSIWLPAGGDVTFSHGERVVTRGNIKIGNRGNLTVEDGTALWAEGLDLTSSNVQLLGKTYFSDDLTIETGSDSNVKIAGEYYGYGDVSSARASKNSIYYTNRSDTDISSAIIVNGRGSTLDLSSAEEVMIAGRSYIASSDIRSDHKQNSDIALGESITVKGGQLAYLLPEELLNTQAGLTTLHNPMETSGYERARQEYSGNVTGFPLPLKWSEPYTGFSGASLQDIGLKSDEPISEVYYNDGEKTYVYFYLNFESEQARVAFLRESYLKSGENLAKMNADLSFYFGASSGIKVGDPSSYLRFVTRGNVLTYDGSGVSVNAGQAAAGQNSDVLTTEQISYQNMWYALNRKMIGSVDLLNQAVVENEESEEGSRKITHNETDADRSVYDNLVNESGLVKFISESNVTNQRYVFRDTSSEDGFTAIMAHNANRAVRYQDSGHRERMQTGSGTPIRIGQADVDKLRLVVCTGDVVIQSGVEFKGIIMAGGTITLEPGAKLLSAPLEAAQIFQTQMNSAESENETISPKRFFWDGDKYVLGNGSASGVDSSRDSDSYHIEDYITYENWNKK